MNNELMDLSLLQKHLLGSFQVPGPWIWKVRHKYPAEQVIQVDTVRRSFFPGILPFLGEYENGFITQQREIKVTNNVTRCMQLQ